VIRESDSTKGRRSDKGSWNSKKEVKLIQSVSLHQKVAKRLHNEIQAMNQPFPSSISSADGLPGMIIYDFLLYTFIISTVQFMHTICF